MMKVTASEFFHLVAMEGSSALGFNGRMGPKRLIPQKRQFRRTFLRQWREHRDLTLEQLADRIETTPSHLSMLERGMRGYTQNTLEAIAEALRTDAASLLMRDPSKDDAIWSVWEHAKPGDRQKIVEIAKTITGRTGTDD